MHRIEPMTWSRSAARLALAVAVPLSTTIATAAPPVGGSAPARPAPSASAPSPAAPPVTEPTFLSEVRRDGVVVRVRAAPTQGAGRGEVSNAAQHQRLAERLTATRLDVSVDAAQVRQVFDVLAEATGVQIVPWYAVEEHDPGLDPKQKLDLTLRDVTLLAALETIGDRCKASGPCTWQIHNGLVEVGPKTQLARETARVSRVYAIADLCLEPPRFNDGGSADIAPTPLERWAVENTGRSGRKTPRLVAASLLDFVSQSIEPQAWRKSDEQVADMARRGQTEEDDVLSFHGQWGSMWYRSGDLVLVAPDFVHRALAGYDPKLRSDLPPGAGGRVPRDADLPAEADPDLPRMPRAPPMRGGR